MTNHQDQAVWELMRQGFHGPASEAEEAWARGKRYAPKETLPIARSIMELIRIANWESQVSTPA